MVKLRSLDFNLQIMEHYLNLGSNLRQVNCRVDFTHHSLHLKATGSLRCQYPAFQGLELMCMHLSARSRRQQQRGWRGTTDLSYIVCVCVYIYREREMKRGGRE